MKLLPSPATCFDLNTCTALACFLSSQCSSVKNSKYHKVAKVKTQAAAVLANKLLSQAFRTHPHRRGNYAAVFRPKVKDASLET